MAASCIARGLRHCSNLKFNKVGFTGFLLTRTYARGIHRVPVKVFAADEAATISKKPFSGEISEFENVPQVKAAKPGQAFFETPKKISEDVKPKENNGFKDSKAKILKATETAGTPHKKEQTMNGKRTQKATVAKDHEELNFQIIKDKHTSERKLVSVMQKVKSSKARKSSGLIYLEGERQIQDAIEAGATIEMIFFSDANLVKALPLKNLKKLPEFYQVNYNQIQLWSDLVTSPGIIGIFKFPSQKFLQSKIPLTVICDNIRDPGNMGTVLRCAASVGCNIIVMKECVDVWDSKVLRSSCGAHFRVPMKTNVAWETIRTHVTEDASVILAYSSFEGSPVLKDMEQSLLKAEVGSTSTVVIEIDKDTGEAVKLDTSYKNPKLLSLYRHLPLPEQIYCDINLDYSKPIVLVIGGETHGVSNAAHKLAHDFCGVKAHIPLENGMESLNVGTAFGILAYEIRRKFLQFEPPLSLQMNKV